MMAELLPARTTAESWPPGAEGSIGCGCRVHVENIFRYTVIWLVRL